ncbi:hypothetical protein M878_06120 [Streptomyces roseochromogenus subsp. oscitans DS 12.976]|uniref:Transcriptional regulator SbtR-like C-terminal domain-containing protein n=1 Tax=Streptomyces roseochromogenus subsp. oscitans DS 12.976 TaxID=1352936 RepID=V6KTP9_STRRC|nr:hypothetical protein M878_06120 [Streptomyces roseochromogenus subsp. oscitans DS 12.976]
MAADRDQQGGAGRGEAEQGRQGPAVGVAGGVRQAGGLEAAVTRTLVSAAPMEPPTVRMLAFIPVAAPVCSGGTLPAMRLAIEAKASPMPSPNRPATTAICHWASCQKVRNPQASAPRAAPVVLERAQNAGVVRPDMGFTDLLRMVAGITATAFDDDARRDRVPAIALDGVRTAR